MRYFLIVHMTFEVGVEEHHRVDFTFDRFWGGLKIKVDGVPVVEQTQVFSVRLVKKWEFEVGENEKHRVRIVKRRPLFFAGARPQPVTAFVDDRLVAQQDR
jgi:hypothetical protein